MSPQLQY